jgi:uncharacterized membrane protein
MKDYLAKIIDLARSEKYSGSSEDVKKVITIRERYAKGDVNDHYHIDEIREVVNRILSKIGPANM